MNLSVGQHNIQRLIEMAIDHSAVKCLEVLLSLLSNFDSSSFSVIDLFLQKVLKRETDQVSLEIV